MFVFWKTWWALVSWNTRFKIRSFVLLPTYSRSCKHFRKVLKLLSHLIYSLVLERNTEAVTQRFFQNLPKLTVNCFLGCVYYTCVHYTCVKTVQIWSFLWSEHGKMWNRKNSVSGHFSQRENVLCRGNLFKYLDCLLIQTIYKFCDMILVGNLNYGYSLISRVYR